MKQGFSRRLRQPMDASRAAPGEPAELSRGADRGAVAMGMPGLPHGLSPCCAGVCLRGVALCQALVVWRQSSAGLPRTSNGLSESAASMRPM